jgi:hypothetical protein
MRHTCKHQSIAHAAVSYDVHCGRRYDGQLQAPIMSVDKVFSFQMGMRSYLNIDIHIVEINAEDLRSLRS